MITGLCRRTRAAVIDITPRRSESYRPYRRELNSPVKTGAAPVTWRPLVRRSRRIGEFANLADSNEIERSAPDTVRQETSVFICGARLKKF
jgi:hypothetical protein